MRRAKRTDSFSRASGIGKPSTVTPQHFNIGHEVKSEGDRLCHQQFRLKMGKSSARHHGC